MLCYLTAIWVCPSVLRCIVNKSTPPSPVLSVSNLTCLPALPPPPPQSVDRRKSCPQRLNCIQVCKCTLWLGQSIAIALDIWHLTSFFPSFFLRFSSALLSTISHLFDHRESRIWLRAGASFTQPFGQTSSNRSTVIFSIEIKSFKATHQPLWCSLLCLTSRVMSLVGCCSLWLHRRSGYVTTRKEKDASRLGTEKAIQYG